MKEIKLTQNKATLVDDEDFDFLNQWRWYAFKADKTYYAQRIDKINGKTKSLFMHRLILKTGKGQESDHKDRNGLNNQRNNLRICTRQQNNMNRMSSGIIAFKGVNCNVNENRVKKYSATIKKNNKQIFIGRFKTPKEAALAYDKKAVELFGEFAYLNFTT